MVLLVILLVQSDLYYPRFCYPRNSIIRGSWGQILVRPTYMKYSQTSLICTSIIRGPRLSAVFWNQNLVRPSTADNRGLTVTQILLVVLLMSVTKILLTDLFAILLVVLLAVLLAILLVDLLVVGLS